jgi:hypothetical protein
MMHKGQALMMPITTTTTTTTNAQLLVSFLLRFLSCHQCRASCHHQPVPVLLQIMATNLPRNQDLNVTGALITFVELQRSSTDSFGSCLV